MDTNQAKMDTNQAEMKANQANTDASLREMKEEMLVKLDAHYERMMARMDYQLEKMEATEEIESKAEHDRVPKEEAAVETVRALKEWYRDRHLAVMRRCQRKKQTQGNGGS
jgi:hypothetical protein